MRPVAPMPWGAAVDTNGLKSSVMLFSGELSMTSVEPLLEELPEPVLEELLVPGAALVVELLEEQAASPAAMRPTAAIATVLLVNGLIVNFDCPLGRYFARADFFISGGCLLLLGILRRELIQLPLAATSSRQQAAARMGVSSSR